MVLAVVLLGSEQISFVEKGGREEEVKKLPVSPSPPPPLPELALFGSDTGHRWSSTEITK